MTIVDRVQVIPAASPPDVINVSEVWKFQVRVTNSGHLSMTNVMIYIQGQNGTKVGLTSTGPWHDWEQSIGNLTVNAHNITGVDTVDLYFKAPPTTTIPPAVIPLVRAYIQSWNANLNHILNDHAGNFPGTITPPGGIFSTQVFPN